MMKSAINNNDIFATTNTADTTNVEYIKFHDSALSAIRYEDGETFLFKGQTPGYAVAIAKMANDASAFVDSVPVPMDKALKVKTIIKDFSGNTVDLETAIKIAGDRRLHNINVRHLERSFRHYIMNAESWEEYYMKRNLALFMFKEKYGTKLPAFFEERLAFFDSEAEEVLPRCELTPVYEWACRSNYSDKEWEVIQQGISRNPDGFTPAMYVEGDKCESTLMDHEWEELRLVEEGEYLYLYTRKAKELMEFMEVWEPLAFTLNGGGMK